VASVEISRSVRRFPFGEPDRLRVDPLYDYLRESEPVSRIRLPYGGEAWLATRYADVKLVLSDPRFSRVAPAGQDEPRATPRRQDATSLISLDPPEHTRLRRVLAKAFTGRRVEELRVGTTRIAEALLDRMIEAGPPVDLVDSYATPLPVTVICDLFGVPGGDRDSFQRWSEAIVSTTSMTPAEILANVENMRGYMRDLVARRRVEPTDDLFGAMIRARDEEQIQVSEDELADLGWGVVAAGHETTASQIPNFVYVLLTNRALLDDLLAHPELMSAAIEELMRYVPLFLGAGFPRYATEDVELSGVLVGAGEPVMVSTQAANRDPAAFPHPEVIDFRREGNSHVGFGHGAHHCLGAQLAKMELQVAVGTLIRRLPGLRFAVAEEDLTWKTGVAVRGPKQLPVAW
jgi:cytochrome P450